MSFLVVSHTPHYRDADGRIRGWGPTVRELDALADRFGSLRHLAPLHPEPAPESALAYRSPRVELVPVPPSGGDRAADKLAILARIPGYWFAVRRELRRAEWVHVRCPANISLVAVLALIVSRRPRTRWIKYAGNWAPDAAASSASRIQRMLLSGRAHRGVVTVNGRWPAQPPHVVAFRNPSFTRDTLESAHAAVAGKQLAPPYRLLFVGQLVVNKGAERAVRAAARLHDAGRPVSIDIVGDGPERNRCAAAARECGIADRVRFHGWLPRDAIAPLYADAHFLVFPSATEGWPKVVSEAMAFGVVPIAGAVSCIGQVLRDSGAGRAVAVGNPVAFADAVSGYLDNPGDWAEASAAGLRAAEGYTYESYLREVERLLNMEPKA